MRKVLDRRLRQELFSQSMRWKITFLQSDLKRQEREKESKKCRSAVRMSKSMVNRGGWLGWSCISFFQSKMANKLEIGQKDHLLRLQKRDENDLKNVTIWWMVKKRNMITKKNVKSLLRRITLESVNSKEKVKKSVKYIFSLWNVIFVNLSNLIR